MFTNFSANFDSASRIVRGMKKVGTRNRDFCRKLIPVFLKWAEPKTESGGSLPNLNPLEGRRAEQGVKYTRGINTACVEQSMNISSGNRKEP